MVATSNTFKLGYTGLASNTSMGIQTDRQRLTNLTHNQPLLAFNNPQGALQAEQGLTINQLNSQMLYKASDTAIDPAKKLADENIKRGFSTFA